MEKLASKGLLIEDRDAAAETVAWKFDRDLRLVLLDPDTTSIDRLSKYDAWLVDYLHRLESAKSEAFVRWFRHKYDGRSPSWSAIEIFEFGQTARLVDGPRRKIAATFGLRGAEVFGSVIAALNALRNYSAHYSRLWNRTPINIASRPRVGVIPDFAHLQKLDDTARAKFYVPIAFVGLDALQE